MSYSFFLESVEFTLEERSLLIFPRRQVVSDIVVQSLAIYIGECKHNRVGIAHLAIDRHFLLFLILLLEVDLLLLSLHHLPLGLLKLQILQIWRRYLLLHDGSSQQFEASFAFILVQLQPIAADLLILNSQQHDFLSAEKQQSSRTTFQQHIKHMPSLEQITHLYFASDVEFLIAPDCQKMQR